MTEILKKGFDPVAETVYLRRLEPKVRRVVFKSEVESAVAEAFTVEFNRAYRLVEGKLVDEQSGEMVEELTRRCGRKEEIAAMETIHQILNRGEMAVNFSPANPRFDYPDNCVDVWRIVEGDRVKWLRFKVENNFDEMVEVYRGLGGQEVIRSEEDILAKPISGGERRLVEILQQLDLVKGSDFINGKDIWKITERLERGFWKEYGEGMHTNSAIVFRFYSTVMAETGRFEQTAASGGYNGRVDLVNDRHLQMRMNLYLRGSMVMTQRPVGGCSSTSAVGQFFITEGGDGKTSVVKGKPPAGEGYKLCSQCGMWYKGSKCPLCN
ncbi:MAG: hypothetical protein WC596_00440 [Candidatus Shapirobacteria bacterium]